VGFHIASLAQSESLVDSIEQKMNPAPQDLIDGLLNFVSLAEDERKLLAAELHDQLLCDLREASLITRRVLEDEHGELRTGARTSLNRIIAGLEQAANEARRIMENLRPSVLDSFGLRPALESALRRAAEHSVPPLLPRLDINVTEEELERLCEEEQLAVYRIVQEALTNAAKHAHASSISLSLCKEDEQLLVRVTDDGVGLPPVSAHAQSRGMENMRFRAQLIRATLQWRAGDGTPQGATTIEHGGTTVEQRGTTVELRLDLKG
jgi:signal transduction histidine kinase